MLNLKIEELEEIIANELPQFKKAVDNNNEKAVMILHQDAFAADLQPRELFLLGCFIKYNGLNGIDVHITGKNSETI